MAITFDGNEYYSNNEDLIEPDAFTYAFWANVNNPQVVLAKRDAADTTNSHSISLNLGLMVYTFSVARSGVNASVQYTTTALSDFNVWKHYAFVYEKGSAPKIYLDGVDVSENGTAGAGTYTDASGRLDFCGTTASTGVVGSVCEFGYWNKALSAADILNLSENKCSPALIPDGLIICWRMYYADNITPDYQNSYDGTATFVPGMGGVISFAAHPEIKTKNTDTTLLKSLSASEPSYVRGKVITQEVQLENRKIIAKASLYLHVINEDRSDYIQEEDGIACWDACNFQQTNNEDEFIIDDSNLAAYSVSDDTTNSQGYLTNYRRLDQQVETDVFLTSPKLYYSLYLSDGTYSLFCRCHGNGTIWHGWNDTPSIIATTINDNSQIWRKFGSFYLEEPLVTTLNLYFGDVNAKSIFLDQFALVRTDADVTNVDWENERFARDTTKGPFNTFVKFRSKTTSDIAWGWKSSNVIRKSGWHNYAINDYSGPTGFHMDFVVISGRKLFNAQWVYKLSETDSPSYYSDDFGNNFKS